MSKNFTLFTIYQLTITNSCKRITWIFYGLEPLFYAPPHILSSKFQVSGFKFKVVLLRAFSLLLSTSSIICLNVCCFVCFLFSVLL
jgi:hypothetical protein